MFTLPLDVIVMLHIHFIAFVNWEIKLIAVTLKATSHSTIFNISMRPWREDQKHRHRFTRYTRPETLIMVIRATFHLTISMCGQRATGKIKRNNYHHESCGPSLTGKTSSVPLIFTHRKHRNVKNR